MKLWHELGTHGANSHHLCDTETVSEVVERVASVVLLNGNLQQCENSISKVFLADIEG